MYTQKELRTSGVENIANKQMKMEYKKSHNILGHFDKKATKKLLVHWDRRLKAMLRSAKAVLLKKQNKN